jgi:hypothetical protein
MVDRVAEVEARLVEMTEALRRMEQRVAALEQGGLTPSAARRRARQAQAAHDATVSSIESDVADAGKSLSLVGRTLLVLAGAFVLRALTDSGTLPAAIGVAAGLVYAGSWVVAADRAGAAGRRASAVFHLVAAIAIGFPLLFEAATRFRLLSPLVASAMLAAFTGPALAVAARRRHEVLAWVIALGGIGTATGLMLSAGRMAPPVAYLILLGIATLWLGYVQDWHGLRWPVALVADVAVLVLALRAVHPSAVDGPATAMALEAALMALYLGSFATRTLLLDREVVSFEVVQTAAVLLVGLGGAAFVASSAGRGEAALGVVSVAFGLAAYAVAFAFVERRHRERHANFYFYASVALVFVLAGTAFALQGWTLPSIAWAAFAVVSAALARAYGRRTLAVHAVAYAIAGAFASGLLAHAAEALVGAPGAWGALPPSSLVVVAAIAATAWVTASAAPAHPIERVPRVVLVAALAAAVAGIAVGIAAPAVAGSPGAASAGAVATVRTVVLATGALLLAALGRLDGWAEARWLVYPVLGAVGVKILVEDLPRSRPATLFLAFALYGVALILVPRLRRREAPPPVGTARA